MKKEAFDYEIQMVELRRDGGIFVDCLFIPALTEYGEKRLRFLIPKEIWDNPGDMETVLEDYIRETAPHDLWEEKKQLSKRDYYLFLKGKVKKRKKITNPDKLREAIPRD